MQDNSEQFTLYLEQTLIPDLRASGSEATADDFAEAVHWIEKQFDENCSLTGTLKGRVDGGVTDFLRSLEDRKPEPPVVPCRHEMNKLMDLCLTMSSEAEDWNVTINEIVVAIKDELSKSPDAEQDNISRGLLV